MTGVVVKAGTRTAYISVKCLGLAGLLLAITGCATNAKPIPPQIAINIADGPTKVRWVRSFLVEDGLVVTGLAGPRAFVYRLNRGHLHVTATFSDGRVPVPMETVWRGMSRRGRVSTEFRAKLVTDEPEKVASITVRYFTGRSGSGSQSGFTE